MFNHSEIRTGLYGLVGLRNGQRTEFAIVSAANQATSSGMYFQDYHSLVTVENLVNIMPEGLSDADFNTWFANLVKGSVVKTVNTVMQRFRPQVRTVLENVRLFDYPTVFDTPYTVSGNAFVGYEVELEDANNIMLAIDSIGLMFTGAETFNLYVFHSSRSSPIYTISVTTEASQEVWRAQTAKTLERVTSTYSGGKFYIGYLQQDLSSQPINREWNQANVQGLSHWFTMLPIKVNDHASATLFDIDAVEYTSYTYGLNFNVSIQVNVTRQILAQKSAFTNVIGYGVAVDVLEQLANSIRDNAVKKEVRDLAFAELNAEQGLKAKFEQEIKTIYLDIAGLDDKVMPKSSRLKTFTAR